MTQLHETSTSPMVLAFTGGGTAGHVWPHFALSQSPLLQKVPNLQIHYIGSQTGMERGIVLQNAPDWVYHGISTGKLRRYVSIENLKDIFKVVKGFFDALLVLKKIKPSALFSKGGFVSAPVVWAAWVLGIPSFIHESDATPALATKLCLPFCRKVFVSFSQTTQFIPRLFRKKVCVSGLPLRTALFEGQKDSALSHFSFNHNLPVLLVFGGSLGAENLNQIVRKALPRLVETHQVLHIVGKGKGFESNLDSNFAQNYIQKEFLTDEMSLAYAMTDLALCRAGASTLFELKEACIPMLLVPLGLHQSRGDQIINAKIFMDAGLAEVKKEEDLTPDHLISWIQSAQEQIVQKRKILKLATGLAASEIIAKEILSVT